MKIKLFSVIALLLLLTGCIESINPLYSKDKSVYSTKILGTYSSFKQDDKSEEFVDNGIVLIKKSTKLKDGYEMVSSSKGSMNFYLVKLGDSIFIDEYQEDGTHYIIRIEADNKTLTFFSNREEGQKMRHSKFIAALGGSISPLPTNDLQKVIREYADIFDKSGWYLEKISE